MYISGKSGDQVELQADTPDAKPRIVFVVSNIRQTTHDLRVRGLAIQKSLRGVSVTDPDGTIILFVTARGI